MMLALSQAFGTSLRAVANGEQVGAERASRRHSHSATSLPIPSCMHHRLVQVRKVGLGGIKGVPLLVVLHGLSRSSCSERVNSPPLSIESR